MLLQENPKKAVLGRPHATLRQPKVTFGCKIYVVVRQLLVNLGNG